MLHEAVRIHNTTTTLVGRAIYCGATAIVEYILTLDQQLSGAICVPDGVYLPPLHVAIQCVNVEMVRLLLQKGASVKSLNVYGHDAKTFLAILMPTNEKNITPAMHDIKKQIELQLHPEKHLLAPPQEKISLRDAIVKMDLDAVKLLVRSQADKDNAQQIIADNYALLSKDDRIEAMAGFVYDLEFVE